MKRVRYLHVLYVVFFLHCSEPFEFDTPQEEITVIDAKISTEAGNSYILAYQIKEGVKFSLSNLDVKIVSSSGDELDFFYNEEDGIYLPQDADFQGEEGMSYRLEATAENGDIFYSTYDSILSPMAFDILIRDTTIAVAVNTTLVDRNGLAAIAEVIPNDSYSKFNFSYSYEHHFTGEMLTIENINDFVLFTSPLDQDPKVKVPVGYELRETWYFFNPDSICDQTPSFPCNLPCCLESQRWQVEYRIKQETMTKNTYEYWKQVQQLINNDGLLFDTYPFPIRGNVQCDSCEFVVVGLFRTVAENYKTQLVNL